MSEKLNKGILNTDSPLMAANDAALTLLVISPAPDVPGGVVAFVEMMKAHLLRCKASSQYVGSHPGKKENIFALLLRVIAGPFQTLSHLVRYRVDVIHINPSFNFKSLVRDGWILLALRLIRFRRVMVYFHAWNKECERKVRDSTLLRTCVSWLLNGAGFVMVLSPEFRDALIAMGVKADKIIYTRTMFDGDALMQGGDVAPQKSILNLSRFERQKGVYELLEAFALLAEEFPQTNLVMAGDGAEMQGLKARTQELGLEARVQFPGYVGGPQKAQLLRACACLVLATSFDEGMPVALLEAMAAGKPVITANKGGIAHIITDPQNGIMLEEVTAGTVANALRTLLSDAPLREKTGAYNRHYAWQRFEANLVTAELETLFYEMMRP